MTKTATLSAPAGNVDDEAYDAFLARLNSRFVATVAAGAPLFTTDAEGLWEAYLGSFGDPQKRQHHNCSACRLFITRFGSLVTLEVGQKLPVIWNEAEAPDEYRAGIRAMRLLVAKAKVTGVFMSSERSWGLPITGMWRHLAVTPPADRIHTHITLTAGQAMAEKREDFGNVIRALNEYTLPVLDQALQLLKTDSLYRSEKVLGQAQWLHDLHHVRDAALGSERKAEAVWRAVAVAPAGFCHPRSSVVGTLLDDIAAGMSFEVASRRFAAKMHPLQYQRPQAAPAAGNIAQAEKLFAQLGLAPALQRRIARIDEVPKVWEPKPQEAAKAPAGGVFGHLTPKDAAAAPNIEIPAITITLEKFVRTVIPTAETMEVLLGSRITGIVITTAVNADAPKLFQWDHPFSHYVWHGGSTPAQFGLSTGWAMVSSITRLPARWNDDANAYEHRGDGIILLLDGARESREAGNALFPEQMRSELHSVRSTIEAYSRGAKMNGLAEGSAVGIDLRKSQANSYPATVRVTAGGRSQAYKIDRWD